MNSVSGSVEKAIVKALKTHGSDKRKKIYSKLINVVEMSRDQLLSASSTHF